MVKLIGTIKITDRDTGKVLLEQPMHSFVQNFAYFLYANFIGSTGTAAIKDTANASQDVGAYVSSGTYYVWWYTPLTPPAAVSTWGIQIGRGSTPVALADYKLDTPITHGTGANQFNYGSQNTVGKKSSGSNRYFTIYRPFINGSGAPITVTEVGYVAQPYKLSVGGVFILMARDVLGAPVVVNDGNAIVVEINIQTTA